MSLNKFKIVAFLVFTSLGNYMYGGGAPAGANSCAGATSITSATSSSSCTIQTAAGSTITGDPLATCNTTTENNSIWYSFVASASSMTVMADNAATSGTICQHSVAVYSGSCASLTEIGCGFGFDAIAYQGTTFTVGQTYYVQVSYSGGGPCGDLEVCPYVCPTAPHDACPGAVAIDATPDPTSNGCSTGGPTTNTPTITPAMLCAGSLENTVFYSFTVQNTADVVISMTGITCTGGGAGFQIGYFTGACGSLSNFGCNSGSGGTVTTTITGLTAGQVVTMAVDGNAGATCNFNISATNTVVVLPIELLFFNAKFNDDEVLIDWTTASEHNNDYFTIEKSIDGINFFEITKQDGAPGGNSSTGRKYNAVDPNPEAGLIYYRLKQTDFDGSFEYSNIISVVIENEKDIFNIKPNPTQNSATVSYRCNTEESALLSIYDYNGRVVASKNINCVKGENTTEISMEDQPNGMYFVTVTSNNKIYKTKLIKNTSIR